MIIELLETKVYEGREVVSVARESCVACVGKETPTSPCTATTLRCGPGARDDGQSVIWMYMEDALLARMRGKLPDDYSTFRN